jgi:RNA polymerase sigma-70 factor (ECF subfamily)
MKYTEEELRIRVSAGEKEAFEELYNHYWPQVYGTALHLIKVPEQAKDLSQEIFIKLWEGRAKLAEIRKIDAYIYTLSKNLVIDYLRKKVFDPSNTDFLVRYFANQSYTPGQSLELKEFEASMENAVNSLAGKVKQVFILSRSEGLTHEQIAKRLDITVLSSKTYAVRALQQIRQYLAAHEELVVIAFWLSLCFI